MSHSVVYVLLKNPTKESLAHALAPYDENKEAPRHREKCYCIGSDASKDANDKVDREFGSYDSRQG
jgi:hypothetical protein